MQSDGRGIGGADPAADGIHRRAIAAELAKLTQNPVGNLVSVPFQNNTNFNVGPQDGTQNILDNQAVIPVEVSRNWNVITRTTGRTGSCWPRCSCCFRRRPV